MEITEVPAMVLSLMMDVINREIGEDAQKQQLAEPRRYKAERTG